MDVGRVHKIILDESDLKYYNALGKEDSIGTILFTWLDENEPVDGDYSACHSAKPLHYSISVYPVEKELVNIISAPSSNYNELQSNIFYYLPPISIQNSPISNAIPDILDENGEFNKMRYFKEIENIRPLRPYEGDIMFEGRFGQSIRFGSTIDNSIEGTAHPNNWSNGEQIGNPITIIRNGQTDDPLKSNFDHILEDINGDDSSIYLCSNQQISSFTPASLHDESYGEDIFKDLITEEPTTDNENMSGDVEEDVSLTQADNLPPEELQKEDDLSALSDTDTAYYDIAPTEIGMVIMPGDIDSLPNNYEIPDGTDLNEELG